MASQSSASSFPPYDPSSPFNSFGLQHNSSPVLEPTPNFERFTPITRIGVNVETKTTADLIHGAQQLKQQIYKWHEERDTLGEKMPKPRNRKDEPRETGRPIGEPSAESRGRLKLKNKINAYEDKLARVVAELERRGVDPHF